MCHSPEFLLGMTWLLHSSVFFVPPGKTPPEMVFPSLKWIPETPNFANIFFRSSPWNTFQFSYMNIREFRIQNLGKSKSEMFFPIPHPLQCQRKDFDLAPYNSWQEVGPRWEFCFPYKHNLGFPTYFIPLLIIPWILFLGSFNLLFLRSFELRACPGLGQNHSLGVFVLREGFEFHRKAETLELCHSEGILGPLFMGQFMGRCGVEKFVLQIHQEIAGIIHYFLFICSESNLEW